MPTSTTGSSTSSPSRPERPGRLALCVAVLIEDRTRGFGAALLVWLLTTLVYDGLILLVSTSFADYPLETPLLVLTFLLIASAAGSG